MAMKLGEIFVIMGLSTASFTTDLKKCKDLAFGSAKEMERSFKIMGTALVAGLAAGGTALALLTRQAIDNADHMGKLAQTTGMSVEQFSALAYAAKRSDVEMGSLTFGLVALAKNLEKANQQTLEGKAAHSALSTLFRGNIPVFKNTSDAFHDIAAKISLLPDGVQRTALAYQIMGRYGGEALLRMAGTLEEATARAQKLGVVISTETAAKAAEFNERLKDLHTQVSAFALGIASELLPKLTELTEAFGDVNKVGWGQTLGREADNAIIVMQKLGVAMQIATAQQGLWWQGLLHIGDSAGLQPRLNELRDAMNDLRLEQARLLGDIPPLAATAKQSMDAMYAAAHKWLAEQALADAAAKMAAAEAAQKKLREAFESVTKDLHMEIATFGMSAIAVEEWKLRHLGATEAMIAAYDKLAYALEGVKNAAAWQKAGLIFGPMTNEQKGVGLSTLQSAPSGGLDETLLKNWKDQQDEMQRTADSLNKELRPAWQKYGEQQALMAELVKDFGLEQGKANLFLAGYAKSLDLVGGKSKELAAAWKTFGDVVYHSFDDLIFSGKAFTQVLADITKQLGEMFLKWALFGFGQSNDKGGGGLMGFFGSLLGGLGGLFGGGGPMASLTDLGNMGMLSSLGGFASGGTVYGGGPFLVGERGPELFLPGPGASGGTIVPNGGFGGGGVSIVNNIDNRGADLGTTAKTAALINRMGIEQYHRMVLDRQARTA